MALDRDKFENSFTRFLGPPPVEEEEEDNGEGKERKKVSLLI